MWFLWKPSFGRPVLKMLQRQGETKPRRISGCSESQLGHGYVIIDTFSCYIPLLTIGTSFKMLLASSVTGMLSLIRFHVIFQCLQLEPLLNMLFPDTILVISSGHWGGEGTKGMLSPQ